MARLQRQESNNNLEPLMYLSGNGTLEGRDRNGTFTATPTGALRYAPAPNLRENLLADPSFERDSQLWGTRGASTVFQRVSTDAYDGPTSLQITGTTGSISGVTYDSSKVEASQNEVFSVSFWAKRVSGAEVAIRVGVQERSSQGSFLAEGWSAFTPITNDWQRYTHTYTTTHANCKSIGVQLETQSAVSIVYLVDAVQLERGSEVTPYMPRGFVGPTINLIANPLFNPSVPSWNAGHASAVQDTSRTKDGAYSCKLSITSVISGPYLISDSAHGSVRENQTVTGSFFVYHEEDGPRRLRMGLYPRNSAGVSISTPLTPYVEVPPFEWTQLSMTLLCPFHTSKISLVLGIDNLYTNIGENFWVAQPQIEFGSSATNFTSGGTGGVWLDLNTGFIGTPNNSPSVSRAQFFFEEGTTNLHTNPELAYDASDYITFVSAGSTAVGTRVTNQPDMGVAAWQMEITNLTNASHSAIIYMRTPVLSGASGAFVSSALVKSSRNIANATIRTRINYDDGTYDDGPVTTVTLRTYPQRFEAQAMTANAAKVISRVSLMVGTTGYAQTGDKYWMSKAQVENKSYHTSYAHGSMGTGYAWTGTPHNSASSRANAYLTLPDAAALGIDPVRGALALRARNHTNPINNGAFFHYGNYNGSASKDHMQLRVGSSNDRVVLFWQSGLSAFTAGTLLAAIGDDPHTFIVNWDGVGSTFWMDNANATTTPRVAPIGDVSGQTVGIGSYNTSNANNSISDVIVFDRPLTQGERERLAAMPSWDYDVLFTQPSGLERTRYTTKLQREAQGDRRKLVRAIRSPQLVRSAHTKESPMMFFDSANGTSTYETSSGTSAYSLSGPIRYVPAKDARVNYVKNPSFETNTSQWYAQNTATIERTNERAWDGQYSCKVTMTGTTSPAIVGGNTPWRVIPNKTYTFSAYFYNPYTTEKEIRLSLFQVTRTGNTVGTSTGITVTLPPKQWVRRSVTKMMTTEATNARIWIYHSMWGSETTQFIPGEYFYVDAALFEEGLEATEYFSGKWWNAETNEAGTPHNSESVTALARLYLEDTVNYIQNPSFETNATHWGSGSAGTIVERETTRSYKGSACGKITNTLGNQPVTSCVNQMPVVLNDIVSVQCRILGTPGIGANGRIRIRVLNSSGSTIKYIEGTVTEMDGTWQHLSLSYQVDEATATAVTLYFAGNDTVNPYYIDAAQLEKKRAITEYVDGTMGVGTSWLGTAHGSTSQRSTDTITNMAAAHAPNPAKGSFATWVFVRPESEYQHMFFMGSYGAANTNCAQLYFARESTKNVIFTWYNSNIEVRQVVSTSGAPTGQWAFVYAEWNENELSVSVNNTALDTTPNRTYYPNWGNATSFYVGSYPGYGGTTQFNSYFFDRPLTEAERTALYNNPRSGAKVFAQNQMKLRRD